MMYAVVTVVSLASVSHVVAMGDAAVQAANRRAVEAAQEQAAKQQERARTEAQRAAADQAARDANWQRIQNDWRNQGLKQ